MIIDVKQLHEVHIDNIERYDPRERFYKIPHDDFSDFAISDYSHLVKWNVNQNQWNTYATVKLRVLGRRRAPITRSVLNHRKGDYYAEVRVDRNGKNRLIAYDLNEIVRITFFPSAKYIAFLGETIDMCKSNDPKKCKPKRDVSNYQLFDSVLDYANFLMLRMRGNYLPQKHCFTGREEIIIDDTERLDDGTPVRQIPGLSLGLINRKYSDAKTRATNRNLQNAKKSYKGTTMSEEWQNNRAAFQRWMNDHFYYYPDDTLDLDKDIRHLGAKTEYSAVECMLVPHYINMLFVNNRLNRLCYHINQTDTGYRINAKDYNKFGFKTEASEEYHTYAEALKAGRSLKAEYVRHIVKVEREQGFIPEATLKVLDRNADLIELGRAPLFEPSLDELITEMDSCKEESDCTTSK